MSTILIWLYAVVGLCISVKFVNKCVEKTPNADAPMLCMVGALIIYAWPIYLIYYFYKDTDD